MPERRSRIRCRPVPPARQAMSLAEDVRAGLLSRPRSLPPKYFYDETGSLLFDRICDTQEYYPTRTEDDLLARYASSIIGKVGPRHILELGSGTARKTRHLLQACCQQETVDYWPFDVCREVLELSSETLSECYPWLEVQPLLGDYSAGLEHLPVLDGPCLYVFLGGSLGNFEASAAVELLSELAARMSADDRLLLGVDRVKSPAVLEAAYDDAEGVTAAFNRNLLSVLNRELEADFRIEHFAHRAIYNDPQAQVEMYLVAERSQEVRLGKLEETLRFAEGETILTEISRKFTLESASDMLADAGLHLDDHYTPPNQYFSLLLAAPQSNGHAAFI